MPCRWHARPASRVVHAPGRTGTPTAPTITSYGVTFLLEEVVMVSEQPDPGAVSAEEFARLIAAWEEDGIIEEGLRAVGVERVLDRVFDQMVERFRSDRAGDRDAVVQWRIHVRDEEHPYVLRMQDGSCASERGEAQDPRVTFRADLAAFARLITGQADPVRLVLKGRLRVSGDLLFARHVPTFFEMPRA